MGIVGMYNRLTAFSQNLIISNGYCRYVQQAYCIVENKVENKVSLCKNKLAFFPRILRKKNNLSAELIE